MAESKDIELQKYSGSCHCGAYAFSLQSAPIKELVSCNCSNCYKNGFLWIFLPKENFTVEKGEGSLKEYWWGRKECATYFCPTCGSSISNGSPKVNQIAFNVRMLHDFDTKPLSIKKVDMSQSLPLYVIPEPPSIPKAREGMVVRTGSCHCGAVTYTLQTIPDLQQVKRCDCSICYRNAYAWYYAPSADDLVVHKSRLDALSTYSFGPKRAIHNFCGSCGVNTFNFFSDKVSGFPLRPVNVRTLNGGINVDELEEWKKEIVAGKKNGEWVVSFKDVQEEEEKT